MADEVAEDGVDSTAGSKGKLSDQWAMCQFVLKDGMQALWDDAAITTTLDTAEDCLTFLEKLEEWANRLKIRKGALSRMLLPFDLETNSNDQASSASSLGSRELEGLISDEERKQLVSQAVKLRRLIRVKVADCNDVEQAREALKLTAGFLRDLRREAGQEQRTMTSLLREL